MMSKTAEKPKSQSTIQVEMGRHIYAFVLIQLKIGSTHVCNDSSDRL